MQVFNFKNERTLATAIQAHLVRAVRMRALRASGLSAASGFVPSSRPRDAGAPVPILLGHVYFLETAVDFGSDVLRPIGIRDATVVPQQVEHRQVRCRTAVGETASGTICQPSPPRLRRNS